MITTAHDLRGIELSNGVLLKVLGEGDHISAVHWNLPDNAVVPRHAHPQEQFGYVIKGGFRMTVGDEYSEISAGDSYFVPADVNHEFVAVGDTEAIDVFSPVRDVAGAYQRAPA
ncbi:cupin domain-containing protein [Actinoplanes sp. NPDC023936]|uniref:cupin domain-containing protein n=1 Tax=Actinoplanes sp. NPDC023936 TaxID=3154910 RepID=UPI0033FCAA7D